MNLKSYLVKNADKYVCLDTPCWRKIALGSELLEILDDYDLNEFPTSVEGGADDYDVWIHIN